MQGSEPTSRGASPCPEGCSGRPGDRSGREPLSGPETALQSRMRPEGAGMDLGGGRERLPEESRWAGSGWQPGLLGAREHRETWQGWGDTQCGARQT